MIEMNAIRLGFSSNHWIKLMESKEYQSLSKAIDDDNHDCMMYMVRALDAMREGDTATAMAESYHALQSSEINNQRKRSVNCPYCNGTGDIEVEYASKREPDMVKTTEATCAACLGVGQVDVSKLFNDQLTETYPENGIVAILRHDFDSANTITKAVFEAIHKHDDKVKQESLDAHFSV